MGQGFGLERRRDEFEDEPYDPEKIPVPPFLPDHPDVRRDLAGYYGAVTRFDAVVGALVEVLESSGRAQETLLIIMSDHGMPFPGAKASSYDSGHQCPLVIRSPDQRRTAPRRRPLR